MSECTVRPILDAVSSTVCLIHTRTGLIVAKMIASLCIPSCAMQVWAAGEGGGGVKSIQRSCDQTTSKGGLM